MINKYDHVYKSICHHANAQAETDTLITPKLFPEFISWPLRHVPVMLLQQCREQASNCAKKDSPSGWFQQRCLGAAIRLITSSSEAKVPRPNVSKLAAAVEERRVGTDVGVAGAEGAKVRVTADVVELLKIIDGLVVELLSGLKVLVSIGVFGHPNRYIGPSVRDEVSCQSQLLSYSVVIWSSNA